MDVPGTADPTAWVTEEPPSLSDFEMPRTAWAARLSVSVAVTERRPRPRPDAVHVGGAGGAGRDGALERHRDRLAGTGERRASRCPWRP